jgi:hypothetical protein
MTRQRQYNFFNKSQSQGIFLQIYTQSQGNAAFERRRRIFKAGFSYRSIEIFGTVDFFGVILLSGIIATVTA